MKIWVDADACPTVVRDILFRASARTGTPLTLLANHPLKVPPHQHIRFIQVASGFDKADDEIVKRISAGDLAITQDLPLAADILAKQGLVLTSRGERLTENNIKARLNMRDFLETMRASGEHTGGPSSFDQSDRKRFADQLDRILARNSTS